MLDTGKFPKGISSSITIFLKPISKRRKEVKSKKSQLTMFFQFSVDDLSLERKLVILVVIYERKYFHALN